jgi:hypothetical protein
MPVPAWTAIAIIQVWRGLIDMDASVLDPSCADQKHQFKSKSEYSCASFTAAFLAWTHDVLNLIRQIEGAHHFANINHALIYNEEHPIQFR